MKFKFLQTNRIEVNKIINLLNESVQNPFLHENFKSNLRASTTVNAPHNMYVIDLNSLKTGDKIALRPLGKRYLITDNEKITGGAEISGDANNNKYSLHDNPYNDDMDKALTIIEKQLNVDDDFEVSFIKIPALHIGALQLEGKRFIYYVSLDEISGKLKKFYGYSASEFFNILKKLALELNDEA